MNARKTKDLPEQIVAAENIAAAMDTAVFATPATATPIPGDMNLDIVLAHPDVQMPTYAHENDACFDIYTPVEGWVPPGGSHIFDTGLIVDVPVGYGLFMFSRSGAGVKHGLRLANCVGVVDPGYPDTVKVCLRNDSRTPYGYGKGDRIAQAALLPVPRVKFNQVVAIAPSERTGGLGSTGE
jgi:dUTP pyrophosphatase